MRSLTAVLILMYAGLASAVGPARVEIAWEVSRNGSAIAEALDVLELDAKAYGITSSLKGRGVFGLAGNAQRSSRGAVVAGGLRPQEYLDARTGRNDDRASFDWAAKTVTWQYKGPPQSAPMPPNVFDRLTQFYGFVARAPQGEALQMTVFDGRGAHAYAYKVGGREKLKVPAGEFDTVRMVKVRDSPQDRETEFWLASGQHHLPVRILVVDKDGTRIDQVATRLTVR